VLAAAGSASAELVAHWRFDEDSGSTVHDTSGNDNHGTFVGDPQWTTGKLGGALEFNGSSDYVEVPFSESLRVINQGDFSIAAWFKLNEFPGEYKSVFQQADDTSGGPGRTWLFFHQSDEIRSSLGGAATGSGVGMESGVWYHAVVVVTEGGTNDSVQLYVNGEAAGAARQDSMEDSEGVFYIGAHKALGNIWDGPLDDIRIYNHALSEAEIRKLAVGPQASKPNPADGSVLEAIWANLSWKPGSDAVSHDVYVGESFADVNDGAEGTFGGNTLSPLQVLGFPGFPMPEGLQPGTTYYWRIDEVNDTDPNSPWKGDIWSFTVPPKEASVPTPADGVNFADPDVSLNWMPGFGAILHDVYFGDNYDDVNNATGAVSQADATFSPGTLELDKTYYWRVDEFDGITTRRGAVWAFTTMPDIPIADPNLIAWWTFDEGVGTTAIDWSGHGNHVTLVRAKWAFPGVLGDASLNLFGGYAAVENLTYNATGLAGVTVCAWIRTNSEGNQYIASFDRDNYWRLEINGSGGGPGQVGWDVWTSSGQVDSGSVTRVDNGAWHHVCGVFDNGLLTIYIDGRAEPSVTGGSTFGRGNARPGILGGNSESGGYDGGTPVQHMDDVRIYDRALTQEEIVLVMRGDPLLAWAPSPSDGSTPDIDNTTPLRWSAGDSASSHEVYFGTDADAVKNADTSDTTGIYRGSQNATSFTPAEGLEWGAGPFYWRVDENNPDGTVTKGRVWSFTVADFTLVDDFESYTDNDADNEAIWQHWIDGYGIATNGAQAGYLVPPYAEQTIVNGGAQSMPLLYDNTAGVSDSRGELTLTAPRDWTKHGVGVLSLWFRGYPPSVGSFTEAPVGTFTMTGSGTDITGTADEFHYAYKTLTGPGTIVARVDSIVNTNDWAKAGVMIRETLDPNSAHAMAFVTPAQGVVLEYRIGAGQSNVGAAGQETGITAPHWVKLERDAAGFFSASHSTNGSTWTVIDNTIAQNIPMASTVYIGLALTSHNASETTEAKFSNVTMTGNVGAQWANQDIGILGNNAEPLYVALSNSNGTSATVVNDDPDAATIDTWTQWLIDLTSFADQGLNLTDVDKIAIGLGGQGTAGGSGTVFIDDIQLRRP
jgi:hypothetical protein